jgi:hypothetical protein
MARMGHDSERAAMVCLHSSRERQRAPADAVGEAARAELATSKTAWEAEGIWQANGTEASSRRTSHVPRL